MHAMVDDDEELADEVLFAEFQNLHGSLRAKLGIGPAPARAAAPKPAPRAPGQPSPHMEAAMKAPEAGQAGACDKPDTQRFSFSNMLKAEQLPRDPFDNIDMVTAWPSAKRDAKVKRTASKRARTSAPVAQLNPLEAFARRLYG